MGTRTCSCTQVTIFTACAWVNGELQSFAVITDYLGHDKYSTLCSLLTSLGTVLPKNAEVIITIFIKSNINIIITTVRIIIFTIFSIIIININSIYNISIMTIIIITNITIISNNSTTTARWTA